MDKMRESIVTALISGGAGLLGAVIGGILSYLGAYKQIEYQRRQLKNEQDEQMKIAASIIATFLWREIEYNCDALDGKRMVLSSKFYTNSSPFPYGYDPKIIRFNEFNKVKYDLLKYKHEVVRDVLDIYDILYLLSIHHDINQLNQDEYDYVRNLFKIKDKIKQSINLPYNIMNSDI